MAVTTRSHPKAANACDIRTDDLTRQLYASDASIYQILPEAVAFPRSSAEASAAILAAGENDMAVIPRGGGTGLSGGAIGRGLIIDFSKHARYIDDLNVERRTVRVGAGVVLDQLNAFLKPHGLWFGPDVATSSRATLGGMIANNSSGAHTPIYGTTAAHVRALELVFADGRIETVGPGYETLPELRKSIEEIVTRKASAIQERLPHVLSKRWPGYAVDRYLREGHYLTDVLAGSEGTLAAIASAELALTPLPSKRGVCLIYFNSIIEAAHATLDLLELKPAAIEVIDDVLWEQTRGKLPFAATRALLRLDDAPCKCILIVEFFDDIQERLTIASRRNLGIRSQILTDTREMEMVWTLRKAGLNLLTGCRGSAKPVPGIEDVAVPPHRLPEYVEGLLKIFGSMGLTSSFYGHAAAGLLHVRPVLDLHSPDDIKRYRQLSDDVSALVKQVKGSISAEHGVGIGHTEYMQEHLGDDVLGVMRSIKALFDPKNVMNPGKIVPLKGFDFQIDRDLRPGVTSIELPFKPVLAFAAKDDSFLGNLEQCNGCGGCRKAAPTMCPTYVATGDEIMSTRGRSNVIRAVLDGRIDGSSDPLISKALDEALSNCIACKACTTECPSNVNMALLKSELLFARQRRRGVTLKERAIGAVDLLGRLGCILPGLANWTLRRSPVRTIMEHLLEISASRPMPEYAKVRFDHWFREHTPKRAPTRGKIILWDDTFVRYHEPHIGRAAVRVLEAAGFEVELVRHRKCCGRPAFSVGRLDVARNYGEHNLRLLQGGTDPIVFLEPSCYSMFAEDYRELGIEGAANIQSRAVLFEQFMLELLTREPDALRFEPGYHWVAIHAHCHAKTLTDSSLNAKLCGLLPNATVTMLNTGCCGMAGSFGMTKSKYDLSLKIAEPLIRQIDALTAGTEVVATGTSCRHQIEGLTPVHPLHVAEVLAGALAD